MNEKKHLYFIALIPQQELCDEITAIKKDIALRFNSKKALKIIPHITLIAPFQLAAMEHDRLLAWFSDLPIFKQPFKIELNSFGAFKNRRSPVVFIQPVMNDELLSLQKQITTGFKKAYPGLIDDDDAGFNPHITIAYRDLERHRFKEAWEEYKIKPYYAGFEVTAVYLLQHNTRQWQVISTLFLKDA